VSDHDQGQPGLDAFIKGSSLAKLAGLAAVPHRTFPFRGAGDRFPDGTRFAVRALAADARMRAATEAERWLRRVGGFESAELLTETGQAVLQIEGKTRILATALVDPDDTGRPYAGVGDDGRQDLGRAADEIRALLEAEEIEALFEEWIDFNDERSPLSKARSWAEFEGLLAAVGKGSVSRTSLNRYDSASLRFMLRELAARHWTPTRPSSSPTSPASDSSDSSTDPETDPSI
jgi:hypothetical protein